MNQPSRTAIRVVMTAIAVFMVATLLQLSLIAQNTYGSIVGIVTDSTGAVVPDAPVTVTNIGTGLAVKAQTDAGGHYSVANLLPADYKVEVEKSNFKRTEREHVMVQVGATVRIDVALAIGNVNETVVVNASTPLLQTDSSSLSQQIEGEVVQQMPLNGRNVMNLLELAPGVIPAGGASGSTALDQTTGRTAGGVGWNNYEIGGAIQGWSANYIDGVPNNLLLDNILAIVPTQDAVQEFNVVSSNATADYGRFAGGVVNIATKSGGNAFHGSVYEYFRNAAFNANSWFNNHAGARRTEFNQNQYGASVTGPIKRDKAFFMFTWENLKALTQITNTATVATLAQQNGTFTRPIADPLGICKVANNGDGTYSITNLYTGGCGDPLNRVLKQYLPLPNTTGVGYNYISNTPLSNSQTQYNGRIDYQLSEKNRIFGRYTYWTVLDSHQTVFSDVGSPAYGTTTPTTWPTSNVAPLYTTHQGVLGDTYSINSTTVADLRVSYTRQTAIGETETSNVNEAQFDQYNTNKYYAALAPQMTLKQLPVYVLSGLDGLYQFGGISNYNANWYNTYAVNGSLTKIKGPHSFKAGFEARLMDNNGTPYAGRASGYYNYDNLPSSPNEAAGQGDEFASFLMGYPGGSTAYQFQTYQKTASYTYYQGYYLRDDWQASRNLTLNLGIRYELPGAPAERNNKLAVLLPNTVDPYTGIKGTEALVNSSLYSPRTAVVEKYNLFAPRVGFAYRATENTVLRGGYGLSYIPDDLAGPNGFGASPFIAPFVSAYTTQAVTEGAGFTPVQLQTLLQQTVAGGLVQPATHPAANFMTTYGSTSVYKGQPVVGPVPFQPYPFVHQWNVSLSHQFKGNLEAGITYSGLQGSNLPQIGKPPQTYYGINELPGSYYSLGSAALSAPATTATCPNGPAGLRSAPTAAAPMGNPITLGQCLRPFPYYSDVQDSIHYAAHQSFKSMQLNMQKRIGTGGTILANYTYSKNMANTDTANQQLETTAAPHVGNGTAGLQDYNNPGGEYSLLSYDVTNRFVLAYELNLPFGKGQKFGGNLNGFANALASGWAVNGITIIQSGFPFFIQAATGNLLTNNYGAGQLRPNIIPGCVKKVGGGSQTRVLAGAWFNTSSTTCWSQPGAVQFGNEPRVDPDIRADGIKNFDFSFQKTTPIFESSNFVFRAEFFNIMNRVQFSPPVNTFGSSNFGNVISQANKPRQIQVSARISF